MRIHAERKMAGDVIEFMAMHKLNGTPHVIGTDRWTDMMTSFCVDFGNTTDEVYKAATHVFGLLYIFDLSDSQKQMAIKELERLIELVKDPEVARFHNAEQQAQWAFMLADLRKK